MIEPLIPVAKGKKGPPLIADWQNLGWGALNQAKKAANGSNIGLRLDNYLAIDPDDEAALKICDELEKDGTLPPTVSWRTWRNRTVRIYQLPPKKYLPGPIKPTGSPKLELRMGAGQYVLIPPSIVHDVETNHTGEYSYIAHCTPSDLEPAELPIKSLEKLIDIAKSGGGAIHEPMPGQKPPASTIYTLSFEKGNRDNSIYSIALALRKGGMGRGDVELAIRQLAASCDPPMSDREAIRKVESAFKDTPGERNFQAEIELWVNMTEGTFSTVDLDRELNLSGKNEKTQRRIVLKRLRDTGIIKRIAEKSNLYTKINNNLVKIEYELADANKIFHIKWPFRLQELVNIFPGNIIIVAGTSNAGKTAFLLNTAAMNCLSHTVNYFSSEMGAIELRNRLDKFELPLNYWKPVNFYDRNYDFASVVSPTGINIIDYLEISNDFFQIGAEIKSIHEKLTTGIAIIAIQKKRGTDYGRGGEFTLEKARLYLSIDPNVLKIVKGKNRAKEDVNPNNMEFRFKLVQGCKFIRQ